MSIGLFKIQNSAFLSTMFFVLVMTLGLNVQAQETVNTYQSLEEAIQTAIANNPRLKAADLQTQQEKALKGASWNLPKTSVSLTHGQYNSIYNNDNQFNVTQSFAFPTVYANQNQLAKARVEASEWMRTATQNELVQQVKATWYTLWLEKSKQDLLLEQDSIYQRFVRAANLRYETGESNLLEKATAESQVAEIKVLLQQNQSDIKIYRTQLQTLLNSDSPVDISVNQLGVKESTALLDTHGIADNPTLAWFRQQIEVAEREKSVEKSRLMPDLTAGYFNQSLNGPNQDIDGSPVIFNSSDRFTGFQIGVAIPIFGAKSQASAIKASELKRQENEARLKATSNELEGRLQSLIQQHQKFQNSLEYYESNALPQAELILKQAQKGFESGDIGYVEYIQGLNRALGVRFNYLDILNQYNQASIQIEFIVGN
jgi:cobalt-zinc-cadmium resistance protein CzcA